MHLKFRKINVFNKKYKKTRNGNHIFEFVDTRTMYKELYSGDNKNK